jgi:hypothetical protein
LISFGILLDKLELFGQLLSSCKGIVQLEIPFTVGENDEVFTFFEDSARYPTLNKISFTNCLTDLNFNVINLYFISILNYCQIRN